MKQHLSHWWLGAVFPLIFFLLGLCFLPYPGLQDDEVLFSNAIFDVPDSSYYDVTIFHHRVPLMLLSYLGTLKAALYVPIFRIFEPSYLSVRLPVLLLGTLTIWLFFRLLLSTHGLRAAWIGALLLSTNAVFLMTTCYDWGPVALQNLLLVTGLLLGVKWWKEPRLWWLFSAALCFGLAMWDKALFVWTLAAITVAVAVVFPRELLRSLTVRNLAAAAAGFCLGALPLIKYNLSSRSRFATFRSNVAFDFTEVAHKFLMLRRTYDGGGLLAYIVAEPWAGHPREASTVVEHMSFGIESIFGELRNTEIVWAFALAILLVPVLWRTRARKPLLFSLIAAAIAWSQMAITKGAGSSHHTILLAPLLFLFLAVAFAEASTLLRRTGAWILAGFMVFLAGQQILSINQNLYQLARYGDAGVWSDAIYGLSRAVDRVPHTDLAVDDWGMFNALVLLHRGQLHAYSADESFLRPGLNQDQTDYYVHLLENDLWIGHVPDHREFPVVAEKVERGANSLGFRKELIETVPDRNGRPVFELFRFVRTPPARTAP